MSLYQQINDDLKTAMKAKSERELMTLRMLLTGVKNKMISLGDGGKTILNDEQMAEVIKSEVKKRKDSIDAYKQGGREDLVKTEEEEVAILQKYLPEQMSEQQLEEIVRATIKETGLDKTKFGQVMGQVMGRVKGKADGGMVSAMVKKVLEE